MYPTSPGKGRVLSPEIQASFDAQKQRADLLEGDYVVLPQ